MLRFLSRRKVRNNYADNVSGTRGGPGAGSGGGVIASSSGSQIKPQRIVVNKNKIDCRVILLDNTDLSIELSVSIELHTARTIRLSPGAGNLGRGSSNGKGGLFI